MDSMVCTWVPQGTFHHAGFVVACLRGVVEGFAESLGAEWDGRIVHDPQQMVQVTFLRGPNPADPLLELIEPAEGKSPVLGLAKRGGGLHHLCYVVDSLEERLERSRARGALIVRQPVPAAAFGGRRIAWVYTRNRLLIEYLESAELYQSRISGVENGS